MKIILLKDQPGIGKKGEVHEVSDGHAKNYLITRGLAEQATPQMISKIQNESRQQQEKQRRESEANLRIKNKLEGKVLEFRLKTGTNQQIYGSIQDADVAKMVNTKFGLGLDRKHITIPHGMKKIGDYTCEVEVAKGLVAEMTISIISEDSPRK
jgi:large subunit ribosomal protein L9